MNWENKLNDIIKSMETHTVKEHVWLELLSLKMSDILPPDTEYNDYDQPKDMAILSACFQLQGCIRERKKAWVFKSARGLLNKLKQQ